MLIRMELLKLFSLWHDQRGELTQEDVVRIGIELCRAVEHCHRNKIIHCDIKLKNILVDAEDWRIYNFIVQGTYFYSRKN